MRRCAHTIASTCCLRGRLTRIISHLCRFLRTPPFDVRLTLRPIDVALRPIPVLPAEADGPVIDVQETLLVAARLPEATPAQAAVVGQEMATTEEAEAGPARFVPLPATAGAPQACAPTLLDAVVATRRVAGDGLPSRAAHAGRGVVLEGPSAAAAARGREGQGVHPAEAIGLATLGALAGPRGPVPGVPVVVGARALAAAAAASPAATPVRAALGDVEAAPEALLLAAVAVAALAGDGRPAMEAVAGAAHVRPVARRRGAPRLLPGPSASLLRAGAPAACRKAEAEGATEAEALPLLAPPGLDAAVVLLATVAVRHAEVGGLAQGVQEVDAAARLLAAASPVVLPNAGRKDVLLPARQVQARAVAPDVPGRETPEGVVHSKMRSARRAEASRRAKR